jgi:hypothetical protein
VTERGTLSGQHNNVRASGWKGFLGPLGRIVLAAVLVVAAVAAAQVVVKLLRGALSLGGALPALYYLVYLVTSVLVAYFVYRAYVRIVEKRPVTELSGDGAPGELGIGAAVGLVLVAVVVGTLWILGYYRIAGANALAVVFVALANDGADLAIKCATHSGSNGDRKIRGRVRPRPIATGFHAFTSPVSRHPKSAYVSQSL